MHRNDFCGWTLQTISEHAINTRFQRVAEEGLSIGKSTVEELAKTEELLQVSWTHWAEDDTAHPLGSCMWGALLLSSPPVPSRGSFLSLLSTGRLLPLSSTGRLLRQKQCLIVNFLLVPFPTFAVQLGPSPPNE